MSIEEAARQVEMQPSTLYNYTTRSQPHLEHSAISVAGHRTLDISQAALDAWWKKMQARQPKGARLHKSRIQKVEEV